MKECGEENEVSKYLFKWILRIHITEGSTSRLNNNLKSANDELFAVVSPG